MSTVEQIENAILQLPPTEFDALAAWMDQQRETAFDRQIAADAQSGRLDTLFQKMESKNAGRPDQPLDEFLPHRRLS
jgi:hypothetical protein